MPDWPAPQGDPKLVGTTDLGAMTPSITGSLGEQLAKLISEILNGTAPAGAASASGDIAQMIKYQIANPPVGYSWNSVPIEQNSVLTIGVASPVVWWRFDSGGNGMGGPGGMSNASTTVVADTTAKKWYVRNTTAAAFKVSLSQVFAGVLPTGPGGAFASFNASELTLPRSDYTTFVVEFEFALGAVAAIDDTRGIGFSNRSFSATPFGAAYHWAMFYRKTGVGWVLATGDATGKTENNEVSDTSDGNRHIARLEWTSANVKLYIDDVLKATGTVKIPASDGSAIIANIGAVNIAADATDSMRIYTILGYWK